MEEIPSNLWPPRHIPEIPEQIVQAANEANLVVFVGAGLSVLMGCPTWAKLADDCLRQLAKDGLISFEDVQQLSDLDPKKRLTIALQVAGDDFKADLAKLIHPKAENACRVYQHLTSIGCAYVTTNYDHFLDLRPTASEPSPSDAPADRASKAPTEVICRPHQFKAQHLRESGAVIHLHGSVKEPDSMVITTPDYLRHYEAPQVREFLRQLFDRHTVLFVGYGLEEWEILEHVLRKGAKSSQTQASRFMLAGYFAHQEQTVKHLYRYFNESFGVRLLPFNRDRLDYEQLDQILQDWSGRLVVGDPLLADDLDFVLEVADE